MSILSSLYVLLIKTLFTLLILFAISLSVLLESNWIYVIIFVEISLLFATNKRAFVNAKNLSFIIKRK